MTRPRMIDSMRFERLDAAPLTVAASEAWLQMRRTMAHQQLGSLGWPLSFPDNGGSGYYRYEFERGSNRPCIVTCEILAPILLPGSLLLQPSGSGYRRPVVQS
jgi:hypothetical protein